MAVFVYTILVGGFAVLFWLYSTGRKRVKLPPGPPGLPIIGNVHQMVRETPLKLSAWAEQYGKMYTVYLGSNTPALIVNDVPLMKQIFGTMASTGKMWNQWFDLVLEGDNGLINTDGKVWQEQRNFLVKTFKDFGFGSKVSSHLESMMLAETNKLSDRLEQEMQAKGIVHPTSFMAEFSGSTLWALVTGKRITPEMLVLIDEVIAVTQKAQNSGLMFVSWLKYIAPKWSGYEEGKDVARRIHMMVAETFEERKREGHIDGTRDIVSAFVEHNQNMEGTPNSVFFGPKGEFHNIKTVIALLMAGVETSATTINWALFYLCGHLEVQKRLQAEIDEILEDGRDPNLLDKERMPYTEAVILETLRLCSVTPFGLVHQLTDDITVQGQTFPKGLCLMANLFHVHQNQTIWGDPGNFRPERFLEFFEDDGGNKRTKINGNLQSSVVIFQPGRRTCVGQPLARDLIFMFLVKLCQTFNFLPEEGRTKEKYMERHFGLMIKPGDLGIRVERRK